MRDSPDECTRRIAVRGDGRYHIRMSSYLACDLGAESGRVMLGTIADGRLALTEIHRFPNSPIKAGRSIHWNVPALFEGILAGLRKAAETGKDITSLSCDSWGLDCVLFDANGKLIEPVFHYRDPRTAEGVERVFAKLSWNEVFAETGIQFIPINALYHLAMETPERLAAARQIITIGDAFNCFLCGVARSEISMASTTQLYNPVTNSWSAKVLSAIGLTPKKFPELVAPGTRLAPLKPEHATATGLGETDVVASCTHDTGSAVAAVPVTDGNSDWAYLSSGTWSLMGVETGKPLITDECRELNFTNEIGYGDTVRLLKNIIGLWLVQECRRSWTENGDDCTYDQLTGMAEDAEPFRSLINPADDRFMAPVDMPTAIGDYCRETGQPTPETPGQYVRCCLESLALFYRRTLHQVAALSGMNIRRLHIVGGGSKNGLLNQFTANACDITVIAGPTEATALGNIMVQGITAGEIDSLTAGRQLIADSFDVATFSPEDPKDWATAYETFHQLLTE
jgi:rhamnulokinase